MDSLIADRLILALSETTLALREHTQALQAMAPPKGKTPDRVNVTQAAKIFGVSVTTAHHKCRTGEWPSEGEGKNRRVSLQEIRRIRREQSTPQLHAM